MNVNNDRKTQELLEAMEMLEQVKTLEKRLELAATFHYQMLDEFSWNAIRGELIKAAQLMKILGAAFQNIHKFVDNDALKAHFDAVMLAEDE